MATLRCRSCLISFRSPGYSADTQTNTGASTDYNTVVVECFPPNLRATRFHLRGEGWWRQRLPHTMPRNAPTDCFREASLQRPRDPPQPCASSRPILPAYHHFLTPPSPTPVAVIGGFTIPMPRLLRKYVLVALAMSPQPLAWIINIRPARDFLWKHGPHDGWGRLLLLLLLPWVWLSRRIPRVTPFCPYVERRRGLHHHRRVPVSGDTVRISQQ